jgi:hypothetical protein
MATRVMTRLLVPIIFSAISLATFSHIFEDLAVACIEGMMKK